MEHLNKLLKNVEKESTIFKNPDLNFILGLTNTQIKDLKKFAIQNELIYEEKKEFFLTQKGKEYIAQNPIKSWCSPEFPKRPEINLEYLKLEKNNGSLSEIEALGKGALQKAVLQGDVDNGSVMAGQIAGLVNKKQSCKEIVDELMNELEEILRRV